MSGSGPLPNLKTKYTEAEHAKFMPILTSKDGDEIERLMSALDSNEFERYEEYEKDVTAIQKYQKDLQARGQQHLAKGKALTNQYGKLQAEKGKLKKEISELEKERQGLGQGAGSDQTGLPPKKAKCVIL